MIPVQIKFLHDEVFDVPSYGTPGSAAVDLRAMIDEWIDVEPNSVVKIPTGIAIYISDPNYAAMILPRSGLGTKGLVIGNLVGLIDSDYQGELTITAWNRSEEVMRIEPKDRIAQLIIVPVAHAEFIVVDEFDSVSTRGTGGYGSTGVN